MARLLCCEGYLPKWRLWTTRMSGNPCLLPSDPQQRYKQPQARSFSERRRDSGVSRLYRSGEDLEDCMTTVLVQCANCKHQMEHSQAQWSIHRPPRFVVPRLKCGNCSKKNMYWNPVDGNVPKISVTNLQALVIGFKKVGCNLADFPIIPEIIFVRGSSYQERFRLLKQAVDHGAQRPGFSVKRKRA